MLDNSVSRRLPIECQKKRTRRGPPWKPTPSPGDLPDGDERLTHAPGEEPLQTEEGHEGVVQPQRPCGDQAAAQHAPGQPPPGEPREVEVLDMPHAEPRVAEPLDQPPAGVAPVMAEGDV